MEFINARSSVRFSQLYVEKGEPLSDSLRMRLRLAAIIPTDLNSILDRVRKEFGSSPDHDEPACWQVFLTSASLADVLDLVTIVYEVTIDESLRAPYDSKRRALENKGREYLHQAAIVLSSENTGYKIAADGVVHLAVDEEYERSAASIIRGLDGKRYEDVLTLFNSVQPELDKTPPGLTLAIRAIFAAAEALFKLMFEGASCLGAEQIETHLIPCLERQYPEKTERQSAMRLVQAFRGWVEACHLYRHTQDADQPAEPSLDFAVALVSSGPAYLRWLGTLDRALAAKPTAARK